MSFDVSTTALELRRKRPPKGRLGLGLANLMMPRALFRRRETARIAATPFYQAHPAPGRVRLVDLDARGLVDLELGVFFNRIPKAANSTVVVNLARVKFGCDIASKHAKKMFLRPSELTGMQLGELETCFKFTFVRDPYSRTLSAYLYRIVHQKRRYAGLHPSSGKGLPSFAEFCAFLGAGALYLDTHWAPQTELLVLRLEDFDFVGRFENFRADLDKVMGSIHPRAMHQEPARHDAHRTGASAKLADYYNPRTRALVAELYEQDFTAFGYEK